MSTAYRTWLAGLALCFSALVLTSNVEPHFLGSRAMLAMVIIFAHAWVVAVTERACPARGGVDIPRFALGPRLLAIRPGLIAQCLVPVMMLGLVTRSTLVLGLGVAVVMVLTTDVLRQSLIWALPVIGAVMALLTMEEFHTLGDLLGSAKTWLSTGLTVGIWALVLGGSLLRTDVGGIKPKGQLVAFLAGLPGYLAAFFVMTRTSLAGLQPDLLGVALVLLAGGVVQTLIVGFLAKAAEMGPRTAREFPRVQAGSIGMAVMPMLLCVTALLGMMFVSVGARGQALADEATWTGLLALMMLIPLVPAAALVASSLDRVDGRPGSQQSRTIALGALGVWLLVGPMALSWMYAPGGFMSGLHETFTPVGGGSLIATELGGRSFLLGPALGGELMLFGVPAADMCRAATLMVGSVALLAASLVRHSACGLKGTNWGTLAITLGLQVMGIIFLQPRLGPGGSAIATSAACMIMWLVDARSGEEVEESEEAVCEFDGLLDASVAGDSEVPQDASSPAIGLSVELQPQIVPDVEPGLGPEVFEEEWETVEASEAPEIPDPFEESFRGKKGAPIGMEPETTSPREPDIDDFAIDELPDDPFFTPPGGLPSDTPIPAAQPQPQQSAPEPQAPAPTSEPPLYPGLDPAPEPEDQQPARD